MKKYAMLAINSKMLENKEISVRRVLITYTKIKDQGSTREYLHTNFITCCDYLKDNTRSHVYKFKDDGYLTLHADSPEYKGWEKITKEKWLQNKRNYHAYFINIYPHLKPIEFEAKNDKEALKIWNEQYYNHQKELDKLD